MGRQYGSEGKGNIAGHIAPEYDLLLGAGAGGHVEAHDGRVAWIEISLGVWPLDMLVWPNVAPRRRLIWLLLRC